MKSVFNSKNFIFTEHFKYLWLFFILMLSTSLLLSCDKNNLEIQKGLPFEVNVMPIPKEISNSQTIEIRLAIQRTENYSGTKYYIRYFQYDGRGTLKYNNHLPYLPNDLYPLPSEQFRLYYTSQSNVIQSFQVWISDNFGNEKQLNFELNSRN